MNTISSPARRRTVVGTAIALLLIGGGTAGYAAWSSSASGASEARSVTAVEATVTVSTGAADLYPGASGDVHFTVTNPNPYPVRFTDASFTAIASDVEASCAAAVLTAPDVSGLAIDVAANTTSGALSIQDAVTMAAGAGDGCQGRVFTLTTVLTGTSQ